MTLSRRAVAMRQSGSTAMITHERTNIPDVGTTPLGVYCRHGEAANHDQQSLRRVAK